MRGLILLLLNPAWASQKRVERVPARLDAPARQAPSVAGPAAVRSAEAKPVAALAPLKAEAASAGVSAEAAEGAERLAVSEVKAALELSASQGKDRSVERSRSLSDAFFDGMERGRGAQAMIDGQAAVRPAGFKPRASGQEFRWRWYKPSRIFADRERNKAFWRYTLAEETANIGVNMNSVTMPYFIQAGQAGTDPRQATSLYRLIAMSSQAAGYLITPLIPQRFSTMRLTGWPRAFLMIGASVIFFAAGWLSGSTAAMAFLATLGTVSLLQAVQASLWSSIPTQIIGDPSVTRSERQKANAVRGFISSVTAVIMPVAAGLLAAWAGLFGRDGAAGALVFAFYGVLTGLAGVLIAGITLKTPSVARTGPERGPFTKVWRSLRRGFTLVMMHPFLRWQLILSLVSALFVDALVWNVLPEYMKSLSAAGAAGPSFLEGMPFLGSLLSTLLGSPVGMFSLLVAAANVGGILASTLLATVTTFFSRWFKNEESLLIPVAALAVLQAPAFWALAMWPSFWPVLALYGLQAVFSGLVSLVMSGVYQKKLGVLQPGTMTSALIVTSLISLIPALAAAYLYGYVLTGIAIQTSLMLAAGAVTALSLLRVAAPWFMLRESERAIDPSAARWAESKFGPRENRPYGF